MLRRAARVGTAAFATLGLAAVGGPPAAEVLHAPASASLVNAMAGPAERGRYLAVFQYSFVAAELVGPALFGGLFSLAHALPFRCVAGLNLVAVAALAALGARPGALARVTGYVPVRRVTDRPR